MKKSFLFILLLLLGISIGLNVWQHYHNDIDVVKSDTTVVYIDHHDTVPVEVEKVVVRWKAYTIPSTDVVIHDTLFAGNYAQDSAQIIPDSIEINLPITQTKYQDSLYTAWVSGYDAKLDSILIRERQTTILNVVRKKKHWNYGIQAGGGFDVINQKPCVYIGFGGSYNF